MAKRNPEKHSIVNISGCFLYFMVDFIHIFTNNHFDISWFLRLFLFRSRQKKEEEEAKKRISIRKIWSNQWLSILAVDFEPIFCGNKNELLVVVEFYYLVPRFCHPGIRCSPTSFGPSGWSLWDYGELFEISNSRWRFFTQRSRQSF